MSLTREKSRRGVMFPEEIVAGVQTQPGTRSARKYGRIDLPKGMLVAWQGGGRRESARVQTLSLGGIFIGVLDPPATGTMLRLIFEVPGGEVRARGVVVFARPGDGMGIQFRGMDAEERARLAHLLKRLLQ